MFGRRLRYWPTACLPQHGLKLCLTLQGAKGQGRKEHIKVRRRQDSSGIGLVRVLLMQHVLTGLPSCNKGSRPEHQCMLLGGRPVLQNETFLR